jgi:hypothetical protein
MSAKIRAALAVLTSFVINTALLMISYPIWRELKYQRHPTEYWIKTYIVAGVLVTALVWVIAFCLQWFLRGYPRRRLALRHIFTVMTVLIVYAVGIGISFPYPAASWPEPLQALGQFFAEVRFLTFIFLDAPPIAFISGLLFAFVLGGDNSPRSEPASLSLHQAPIAAHNSRAASASTASRSTPGKIRVAVAVVAGFVINILLLAFSYPQWRELRFQQHSLGYWVEAYAGAALFITLLSAVLGIAICRSKRLSNARIIALEAGIMFLYLVVLALMFGTAGPRALLNWPHMIQAINTEFLAEAKFITFILFAAVPMSLVSALLLAFVLDGNGAPRTASAVGG